MALEKHISCVFHVCLLGHVVGVMVGSFDNTEMNQFDSRLQICSCDTDVCQQLYEFL